MGSEEHSECLMDEYHTPLPEFESDEAHDYFITRLFVREGFYDYQGSTKLPEKN